MQGVSAHHWRVDRAQSLNLFSYFFPSQVHDHGEVEKQVGEPTMTAAIKVIDWPALKAARETVEKANKAVGAYTP